jgi:hypothetical protein
MEMRSRRFPLGRPSRSVPQTRTTSPGPRMTSCPQAARLRQTCPPPRTSKMSRIRSVPRGRCPSDLVSTSMGWVCEPRWIQARSHKVNRRSRREACRSPARQIPQHQDPRRRIGTADASRESTRMVEDLRLARVAVRPQRFTRVGALHGSARMVEDLGLARVALPLQGFTRAGASREPRRTAQVLPRSSLALLRSAQAPARPRGLTMPVDPPLKSAWAAEPPTLLGLAKSMERHRGPASGFPAAGSNRGLPTGRLKDPAWCLNGWRRRRRVRKTRGRQTPGQPIALGKHQDRSPSRWRPSSSVTNQGSRPVHLRMRSPGLGRSTERVETRPLCRMTRGRSRNLMTR